MSEGIKLLRTLQWMMVVRRILSLSRDGLVGVGQQLI
jgi:hypothetical protein